MTNPKSPKSSALRTFCCVRPPAQARSRGFNANRIVARIAHATGVNRWPSPTRMPRRKTIASAVEVVGSVKGFWPVLHSSRPLGQRFACFRLAVACAACAKDSTSGCWMRRVMQLRCLLLCSVDPIESSRHQEHCQRHGNHEASHQAARKRSIGFAALAELQGHGQ
jgi:hypothetical protein